jgi:hypothetical protein
VILKWQQAGKKGWPPREDIEKKCGKLPDITKKPKPGGPFQCEKVCNELFQEATTYCETNCPAHGVLATAVCSTAARAALYACYSACLDPWAAGGKDDPDAGKKAFEQAWEQGKKACPEKKKQHGRLLAPEPVIVVIRGTCECNG